MVLRNSDLIDPERGVFSVLGLLTIQVEGPFEYFSGEDIDNEMAKGAVFYAFDQETSKEGGHSVAWITVADVTNDPTEPDVSLLESADVPALDDFLHSDIESQFATEGKGMIQWMSSQLNQSNNLKCLVTAYIWIDRGKEYQNITARYKLKGRKIAILGNFDVAKKDVLAAPIFNIMQSIELLEQPLNPVTSKESPREILAIDFKLSRSELPIRGGWGYVKEDACIIDKNDPVVDQTLPFDGVEVEYVFVEKRIYEEMIIFRPDGEKFSGIRWNLLEQSLLNEAERYFDKLIFEITAFRDSDWEELKAEFESPQGYGTPDFDEEAHERKRQEKMVRFTREFWFDITSFYGQGRMLG